VTKKSVQRVVKNLKLLSTIKNTAQTSATKVAHSKYMSTLKWSNTNATYLNESFTEFKKLLRDFDIEYKYMPTSNEDTWGIKINDFTIHCNRGWYYYDGDKSKSQSDAVGYVLNQLGMELEYNLWSVTK